MIWLNLDLKVKISKSKDQKYTYRHYRRLKSNPKFFLIELYIVDWSILANFGDVDNMEVFWTEEINHCLNLAAPWKLGQKKQNKHSLQGGP